MRRRVSLAAICALQAIGIAGTACGPVVPPPQTTPGASSRSQPGTLAGPLGLAAFGRYYQTQATVGEVAIAATVSLIDTANNKTIATTVTSISGQFVMDIRGFVPETGRVYVLEAVKGLRDNKPGGDAVRLRTFIRHDGLNWSSITGDNVTISPKTTALAIIASHRGLIPSTFLGKLVGSFDSTGTGTTQEQLDEVVALVDKALEADMDPLYMIKWDGSKFELREGSNAPPAPEPEAVRILLVTPDPSATGGMVTIVGIGIAQDGFGTQVFFGALPAQIVSFTTTSLTVIVPTGARSGPLTVTDSLGTANILVTVVPEVTGGIDVDYEPTPAPTPTPEPTVDPAPIGGTIDEEYEFIPTPEPTWAPGRIDGGVDGEYEFVPTPEPTVHPGKIIGGVDGEYEFTPTPEPTWAPGPVGGGIDTND